MSKCSDFTEDFDFRRHRPCPPPYPPPYPPPQPFPCCCCRGADGKSAYQIALEHGFVGTEQQWLDSLKGEPGLPGPFLSSYIEAVGSSQTVTRNGAFVFDTNPNYLDTVGTAISLNADGTIFTINTPGLYHIEWSMNLSSATEPVIVGIMENGSPASALTNNSNLGNFSSGALVNVGAGETPYTVTLLNFGRTVEIENPLVALNTAVSIRILRFADGPGV